MADCGTRSHGHRDGWSQLWFLLLTFRSDHQPRGHSAVDLEFEWSQHHVRDSGFTEWNVGFRNSYPGSHVHAHLQQRGIISVLLHTARVLWYGRHGHGGKRITDTNCYTTAKSDTGGSARQYQHSQLCSDRGQRDDWWVYCPRLGNKESDHTRHWP